MEHEDMTTQARPLNVGVVGLGLAAASVTPAMVAMPHVNLVAGADIDPRALQVFKEKYGAKTYASIEALCDDPDIDTVWIATPNTCHCPHVILAAERGKHVIVEKPMAISLAEAERMIEAGQATPGVQLLCGGSRSSSAVVRTMRQVVVSGEIGRLRAMTTWSATDWILRPGALMSWTSPQGGGVVYRQAPHQVDSVRLLAGGKVSSVRGMTGQWMAPRHTAPGFFSALLEFENGACATLVYSAYGYFMASLFEPGAGGPDAPGLRGRIEARQLITTGTRDEAAAKEQRTLNAQRTWAVAGTAAPRRARFLSDLGLLVVSCEHGDMRQSPSGIYIYGDAGTTEVPLTETRGAYAPEFHELYDALVYGKPVLHSGRWGLATLEVCLAIMQSATAHRDIPMQHQVAVPDGV